MAQVLVPARLPVAMRLRGSNPMLEVMASNLNINLGEAVPGGHSAALTLRCGTADTSPSMLQAEQLAPQGAGSNQVTGLGVSDLTAAQGAAKGLSEPVLSLRTWADVEHARVDAAGLTCTTLTAGSFANLVGDYVTPSTTLPPSAAALAAAYADLSARTSNASAGVFLLQNDTYLRSAPDNHPRLYFATDGATVTAAPAPAAGASNSNNQAFAWTVDAGGAAAADAMTLGASGNLWLRGGLAIGPDVPGATLTASGCNLGVNLPDGVQPECALHVNGAVCAEDGVYMLSDARVKTDLRPLQDALGTLLRIRGCTYARTDARPGTAAGARHVGVIAQAVQAAVPEAVHVAGDGRLSVAYGNLVAVVIEAVREVSQRQDALEAQLRKLHRPAPRPRPAATLLRRRSALRCRRPAL